MKTWWLRFWQDHGDRLIFMTISAIFGIAFYLMTDMKGEAKALLISVAALALNKARGVLKKDQLLTSNEFESERNK